MTDEEGKTVRVVYKGANNRRRVPGVGMCERDVPVDVPSEIAARLLEKGYWEKSGGGSPKKKTEAGEGGKSAKKEL